MVVSERALKHSTLPAAWPLVFSGRGEAARVHSGARTFILVRARVQCVTQTEVMAAQSDLDQRYGA
jgi:hypothetical protein